MQFCEKHLTLRHIVNFISFNGVTEYRWPQPRCTNYVNLMQGSRKRKRPCQCSIVPVLVGKRSLVANFGNFHVRLIPFVLCGCRRHLSCELVTWVPDSLFPWLIWNMRFHAVMMLQGGPEPVSAVPPLCLNLICMVLVICRDTLCRQVKCDSSWILTQNFASL